MLEIVTPAASTALTTLDRAKAILGIADDSDDDYLEAAIVGASDYVCAICNVAMTDTGSRTFGVETVTETFLPYQYRPKLILSRAGHMPVVEIVGITVNGGTALDPTEFFIDKATGLIWRGMLPGYAWHWSYSGIAVTYTAGWRLPGDDGPNLPGGIESAAVGFISGGRAGRGRDPNVKAEDIPGVIRTEYWVGSTGGDTSGVSPSIMTQLSPYRRLGI